MQIVLSTGNIIGSGATSLGHAASQRSNLELVKSLRLNIQDGKQSLQGQAIGGAAVPNGHSNAALEWKKWTTLEDNGQTLYVPAIDFTGSGLQEEREQYDITVKLFFLRSTTVAQRSQQIRQAVRLVLKELHIPSLSLLIVSFPGIYFDEETEDCPEKIKSRGPVQAEPESSELQLGTWKVLEGLQKEGIVQRLGVAEFGAERLEQLLATAEIAPSVNQVNLRDCCSVPKNLLNLAKSKAIDLLVHNDCTDILPHGTLREILGQGKDGAGILTGGDQASARADSNEVTGRGIKGEIIPQWVIKYTAVVANRGVVENKGYFALADVTT